MLWAPAGESRQRGSPKALVQPSLQLLSMAAWSLLGLLRPRFSHSLGVQVLHILGAQREGKLVMDMGRFSPLVISHHGFLLTSTRPPFSVTSTYNMNRLSTCFPRWGCGSQVSRFCMKLNKSSRNSFPLESASSSYSCLTCSSSSSPSGSGGCS